MIKRCFSLQTSILILTIFGTFGSASAQDIVVMGGANIRIIDGLAQPDFYNRTEFGDVDVASGLKTHAFYIENLDLDTIVSITGANITGSTDFTLSTPINAPILLSLMGVLRVKSPEPVILAPVIDTIVSRSRFSI